jgi:hypothetical protein
MVSSPPQLCSCRTAAEGSCHVTERHYHIALVLSNAEQAAEGYRAMDERPAMRTLLRSS